MVTHRQHVISCKGDIENEYVEYDDLFYGKTVYGWEIMQEGLTKKDLDTAIKLKLVTVYER